MMTTEAHNFDVAAYALGVLDPTDIDGFEAHLAVCDECARELDSLLPLADLLDQVDPDILQRTGDLSGASHRKIRPAPRHGRTDPSAPGRGRLSQAAEQGQRAARQVLRRTRTNGLSRASRRRLAAGATLVVLASAISFLVGASWASPNLSTSPSGPPSATALSTGDESYRHERVLEAVGRQNGAQARMVVATLPWGSQVDLWLSGVQGPLRCELVAIGDGGQSTVVGSWIVPEPGYGVDGHPEPLILHAATAITLVTTVRFEIRAIGQGSDRTTLVELVV